MKDSGRRLTLTKASTTPDVWILFIFSLNDMSNIPILDRNQKLKASKSPGSSTGQTSFDELTGEITIETAGETTDAVTAKSIAAPAVVSVEQLNRQIRGLIEGQFQLVWVKGEISNFKAHSSGHFYFSLKDSKSQIRAVMFRGYNSHLKFRPADGQEVIIRGRVTLYEPRGEYQIAAEMMEPVGAGALQKAFEQLKVKLKAEGLFDLQRKRPIPKLPHHIALVTSPTGAAIQDMLNVLRRRNPLVKITLVPTVVQGETAAPKICEALRAAWTLPDLSVIIVGRGGGSIEDMWCFNDEKLARTIVESPVPVISAVGHEIDFTICDFVSDLRAPTPSAAAELVTTSREELLNQTTGMQKLLLSHFQKRLQKMRGLLTVASRQLVDPKRKLQDLMQRNDELQARLQRSMQQWLRSQSRELSLLMGRIPAPKQMLDFKKQSLQSSSRELSYTFRNLLERRQQNFQEAVSLLNSLSPLRTVERGYAVTLHKEKVLTAANKTKVGDSIRIYLSQGSLEAEVKEVRTESMNELF